MLKEILVRILVGGTVVSVFSLLGDLFKPKSFAGLFGAAPSIALASLGLAIAAEGASYVAVEARSMTGGAAAFFVYAFCMSWLLTRHKLSVPPVIMVSLFTWFVAAFGFLVLPVEIGAR